MTPWWLFSATVLYGCSKRALLSPSLRWSRAAASHIFFLPAFKKAIIRTLNEVVTRYFLLHFLHSPASLSTLILGCPKYQHSSPGCRPWLLKGCHSAESGPESTRDPHNSSFKKTFSPQPLPNPHSTLYFCNCGLRICKSSCLLPLPRLPSLFLSESARRRTSAIQDPICAEAAPRSLWVQGLLLCLNGNRSKRLRMLFFSVH